MAERVSSERVRVALAAIGDGFVRAGVELPHNLTPERIVEMVDELRRERDLADEAIERYAKGAEASVLDARRDLAALVEALAPFARLAAGTVGIDAMADSRPVVTAPGVNQITVGDLRRALAAYRKGGGR